MVDKLARAVRQEASGAMPTSVDVRTAGGPLRWGYGRCPGKGAPHALALGNGRLANGIGGIGRHGGKALAEKRNAPGAPPSVAAAPAAAAAL